MKAEADEAAEAAPAAEEAKEEAQASAAAVERAASEQDASTSGRETVPGQALPLTRCFVSGFTIAHGKIWSWKPAANACISKKSNTRMSFG